MRYKTVFANQICESFLQLHWTNRRVNAARKSVQGKRAGETKAQTASNTPQQRCGSCKGEQSNPTARMVCGQFKKPQTAAYKYYCFIYSDFP